MNKDLRKRYNFFARYEDDTAQKFSCSFDNSYSDEEMFEFIREIATELRSKKVISVEFLNDTISD